MLPTLRAQSLVLRGLIAAVLVAGGLSPTAAGVDAGIVEEDARCVATFVVAEAIRLALDATGPVGDAPWDHRSALIDLTIRSCADSAEWLAAAAVHPALLDGADPGAGLTARCADPAAGLAATPVCVDVGAPAAELVARPRVQPRVKDAQRTRYYPIRGGCWERARRLQWPPPARSLPTPCAG
jgi:hypothetical protein